VYPPCHDLVTLTHKLKPAAVFFWTNPWKKAIGRNPTRTTAENINVINAKVKRLSVIVRLLYEFTLSEACLLFPGVAGGALECGLNRELV
jgi:hypothetical protein